LVVTRCTFVEAECGDAFDEVIEAFTSGSVDDIMVDVAIHNAAAGADMFTAGSVDDIVVHDDIEAGADLVTDGSVDDIVVDDVIEVAAAGADLVTDGSVDDIVVDDVIEVAAAGTDLFTDRSVDDIVVEASTVGQSSMDHRKIPSVIAASANLTVHVHVESRNANHVLERVMVTT
jgi:hypothetical protein